MCCRRVSHTYIAEEMLSKKEVKYIQRLALKKFRDEDGLFIVEGPKIVGELIQLVPEQVQKVYAIHSWMTAHAQWLQRITIQEITEDELQRISLLTTSNQVVAVLRQFNWQRPLVENEIGLYLDTVQDPGNFGTIIRIADWFGIKKIVCSAGCADVYNPKVVQSTMASIARVQVYYDNDLSWLYQQKAPVYAATLQGRSVYEYSRTSNCILLIGNESKGIRAEFLQQASEQITIPRMGHAESLNAAVAAGILLSHLTKPDSFDRLNFPN
ncbi:MAG: RNA methyltransferase [Flavisolibacter sp.]|nr:RNA methyltransferase [Flavisolibacter sp.]